MVDSRSIIFNQAGTSFRSGPGDKMLRGFHVACFLTYNSYY